MRLNDSPQYVFWNTGTGKPQTAVTNWEHDLRQVFRAAGQPEGHPHQLRDPFAEIHYKRWRIQVVEITAEQLGFGSRGKACLRSPD